MVAQRFAEIERHQPSQPSQVLDVQRLIQTIKSSGFIDDLSRKELIAGPLLGISKFQQRGIAGSQMDNQKRNQRDAQQRGNHQYKTFDKITSHLHSPPRRGGEAAPLRKCREATEMAQTGWSDRHP